MAQATAPGTTRTESDVEVAGLQLHVSEGGTGPVLVVLHHSTGPLWTPFYDRLAESFTVRAPEMTGYGRSERLISARSPRDLAIVNLQLLDHFGDRPVHLLGLGFGGWVAAEMATMAQGRFSSLTLVGAAGIKPPVGEIHDPMMAGWIDYARLSFSSDDRFSTEIGDEPPEELVELWDYSREMTARVTWRPWMWSGQLPPLLRGVRLPSLVVWGDRDRIIPLSSGEQYAELLGGRLAVLEGGHALDLEAPAALAELVSQFVSEQTVSNQGS